MKNINLEKLFPRFKNFTLLEQVVVEVGVRHLLTTLVSGSDKKRKHEVYHELCKLTKKEKLVLISTIKTFKQN